MGRGLPVLVGVDCPDSCACRLARISISGITPAGTRRREPLPNPSAPAWPFRPAPGTWGLQRLFINL